MLHEDTFVHAAFLRITNPLIVDKVPRHEEFEAAKAGGHDGIIAIDVVDGVEPSDIYVVFAPKQIRSADARRRYRHAGRTAAMEVNSMTREQALSDSLHAWDPQTGFSLRYDDEYGEDWGEMTEDQRCDIINCDFDTSEEEEKQERAADLERVKADARMNAHIKFYEEAVIAKARDFEAWLDSKGFIHAYDRSQDIMGKPIPADVNIYSVRGGRMSSQYFYIETPEDAITVRFSDHPQKNREGGWNERTQERHSPANLSVDPDTDDLDDAKEAVLEMLATGKTAATSPQQVGKIVKRWCRTNESMKYLREEADWWDAGGCWSLAAGVQKAFGGEIYGFILEGGDDEWNVLHVVTKIGNRFIDCNGCYTEKELIRRWAKRGILDTALLAPMTPEVVDKAQEAGILKPRFTDEIAAALNPAKWKVAKDFGYSQYNDREEELANLEWTYTSRGSWFHILASKDGTPAGDITFERFDPDAETEDEHQESLDFSIRQSQVESEWRGTGLGQMLYDKAIAYAKELGAWSLYSDITRSSEADKAWQRLTQRYPIKQQGGRFYVDLHSMGNTITKIARPTDQKIKLLSEQMKLTPEQIEQVIATDPSPNQTDFITWIAKNVSKGKIRLPEDSERIKGQLTSFMKAKRSPGFTGNKDINGYTPETLFATVGNQEAVPVSNKEKDRQTITAGSRVIVTYDDVTIYKVTDAKALSLLSSGTNWCTAQESTGANYLKQGPSYVIFEDGSAFGQLHPASDQFMDRSDVSFHDTLPPLSKQVSYNGNNDEPSFIIDPTARMAVQKLAELEPEVARWFKQYDLPEDELRGMLEKGGVGTARSLQLAMLNKTPLPKEVEDQFPRSKEVDFMLVTKYGMMFHKGKPWKPLEIMLLDLQSPVHEMLTYARRFMNGNWPDGDVKVLSNCLGDSHGWNEQRWNDFALEWAKGVKGGSWPELEDKIRNKAQRRGEAGAFALRYCLDVTGKRWPTVKGDGVENRMLEEKGMEVATKYAPQFIHEPWPELKEKLVGMMDRRYETSSEVLGALVLYAKDVSRQREPDFENVFLAPDVNSVKITDYIRDVIKGRWPEYEDKLTKLAERLMDGYYFNSPEVRPISAYMKELKTRLPGVEKLIKEQVSRPVEGNKLIATLDARDWCAEYCEVAKEAGVPWSEGWEIATSRSHEIEQGILYLMKTDLATARFLVAAYVKLLIKGGHEWPEGEKIIREGAERNIGLLQSLVDRLDERDAKKQKTSAVQPKLRLKPPAVVYHGTTHAFDEFRFDEEKGPLGVHFGTYRQAKFMAENGGEGNSAMSSATPRVISARITLNNPIEMHDTGFYDAGVMIDFSPELQQAVKEGKIKHEARGAKASVAEVKKYLMSAGYDGVTYRNTTAEGKGRSYIVFEPRQIEILNPDFKPDTSTPKPITAKIASHRDRLHYGYKMAVAEGWFSDEPQAEGQPVTRIEMLKPHIVEEAYDHEKHAGVVEAAKVAGCDGVAFKDLKVKWV